MGDLRLAATLTCRMCGSQDLVESGTVEGWEFLECRQCSYAFAPRITREWLQQEYENGRNGVQEGAPETGWGAGLEFLEPALERLGPAPLMILDFGTGDSLHPERLRQRGHRCVAVDLRPPSRSHPDRLTGDIHEVRLPPRRFDLVFAYQVMEHLPEPRPVLERLLELTRPGGLLLVHTDMEVPERFQEGFEHWWYVLPPDHCGFFRQRTFERFVEGGPHEIVFRDDKRVLLEAWTDEGQSPP